MFVGLTIIFGSVLLVDSIKENSLSNKIEIENAKLKGQELFKESMERVDKEVAERMKLWEDSGLPPSMWK